MSRLDIPNIDESKTSEQNIHILKGYLNETIDQLGYEFDQVEIRIKALEDRIKKIEGSK